MKEILISDEEMIRKGLSMEKTIASLAGVVDRKVGYTTKLIEYKYNPLTHIHTFKVEKYN